MKWNIDCLFRIRLRNRHGQFYVLLYNDFSALLTSQFLSFNEFCKAASTASLLNSRAKEIFRHVQSFLERREISQL